MKRSFRDRFFRVACTIAIVLAYTPITGVQSAYATVQPFSATPPGGSGTGGGVGEIWPIGFGFVTGQNGSAWGDDAGDTYQAFTRDTTYISGTDPLGGPQRLLAFVNKNPSTNKPYIKLKENGVYVSGLENYIQTPSRNAAVIVPDYLSAYPILYPGLPQNNAWYIPITGLALDPGAAYEFSFLCGIKANNSMTGVIYTDTSGNPLGYIQYNGSQTYPDENAQYLAKQYDTYLFRNEGAAVTDESKRYEEFIFRFQTYADTAAFGTSLASAQTALATAQANEGTGYGQVDPARVADLASVVASSAAVSSDEMRQRLQPQVNAAVAALDAAVANAQVLNGDTTAPVTMLSGLPAGGTSAGPVTLSLSALDPESGVARSSYTLDGGAPQTYTAPFTVSAVGSHTLTYYSVDAAGNTEAARSATFAVTLGSSVLLAPGTIMSLKGETAGDAAVALTWNAPSDDLGRFITLPAAAYDIRCSTAPISSLAAFMAATPVSGAPVPGAPGTLDSLTVSGLTRSVTYYFAIRSADAFGNWSAVSNVVVVKTLDKCPPAAVADLSGATGTTRGSVALSWTAPADDLGTGGAAFAYQLRCSASPITADNFASATLLTAPKPLAAGSAQTLSAKGLTTGVTYYFAITSKDAQGNWSAVSNIASAVAR